MARAESQSDRCLEEAMLSLLLSQAKLALSEVVSQLHWTETDHRMAELRRRIIAERFARVEFCLMAHSRILADRAGTLVAQMDAILEKSGLKDPEQA